MPLNLYFTQARIFMSLCLYTHEHLNNYRLSILFLAQSKQTGNQSFEKYSTSYDLYIDGDAPLVVSAQSAGTVVYTDCISAVG